jgi:spermidine/putrescine transport system substrate-binding protein
MKKKYLSVLFLLLVLVLSACNTKSIKVYLPSEYISDGTDEAHIVNLVNEFTKETGIKVELIEFASNEVAVSQIATNSYDLVIPSDYAIEELVAKELLDEIDWSRLSNISESDLADAVISHTNQLKNSSKPFDLLNYSVPYFYGNVGILYNTNDISLSDLELNEWDSLRVLGSSSKRVMLYDSSRDMFSIALKQVFSNNNTESTSSINKPSVAELNDAITWLKSFDNSYTRYMTDQIFDDMPSHKLSMAVSYSGDALYLMAESPELDYYVPRTGTNVFIDAFAIPKNAKNIDYAYEFIDFFSNYENNYINASQLGYTSVRKDVILSLIEDEVFTSSYQIAFNEFDEVYRYDKELKDKFTQEFEKCRI